MARMLLQKMVASEQWFKLTAGIVLCTWELLTLIDPLSSRVRNKGVLSQAVHMQLFYDGFCE